MENIFELKHIKNISTDIIRNMIPILMFILRILGKLNIKWMNGLIDLKYLIHKILLNM